MLKSWLQNWGSTNIFECDLCVMWWCVCDCVWCDGVCVWCDGVYVTVCDVMVCMWRCVMWRDCVWCDGVWFDCVWCDDVVMKCVWWWYIVVLQESCSTMVWTVYVHSSFRSLSVLLLAVLALLLTVKDSLLYCLCLLASTSHIVKNTSPGPSTFLGHLMLANWWTLSISLHKILCQSVIDLTALSVVCIFSCVYSKERLSLWIFVGGL